MKNKNSDLRNHMFQALERLNDEQLVGPELKEEIERARALSDIGKVIVESAKTEVLALKLQGRLDPSNPPKFLDNLTGDGDEEPKQLNRPAAVYTNLPIRKAE